MEGDEEMYLLGGSYGGGRGDVPAWRQIWRRTRRYTCLEADMEEAEEMNLEADMEEDEEMYLEADIEEDHALTDIQQQLRNS